MVVTSDFKLYEFGEDNEVIGNTTKIRSAVYNSIGDHVLALRINSSNDDPQIFVLKSGEGFNEDVNLIKLDFQNEVRRNVFRAYYITEFENDCHFIFGAYFETENDLEDLIG